ncbi:hypothetical protein [Oceanibacterium hippocampi]|uniref:DUF927 domain-containing protein n=1 Tax=Oceanibacterium hippocampi TaxID=745714 RepID=A0A1Y5U5T7_9PROT|nr:hypothetical protein [Oceanibacterium hippocampi]SLN77566.1 hypothetical protein OCH7691_04461 [Oceanibacterium hippocampi]
MTGDSDDFVPLDEAKRQGDDGGAAGRSGFRGPVEWAEAPVTPLGHWAGTYYFLSRAAEIRTLHFKDLRASGILSLFGGRVDWLSEVWPMFDQRGRPIPGAFSANDAAAGLIRACEDEGFFDPAADLRGPGIWRADDLEGYEGGLILHCGDRIGLVTAEGRVIWGKAGRRLGAHVYPKRRRQPRPADVPASARDVAELEGFLGSWNWGRPSDPKVILGYLACAMMVGATRWRPHVWVTGDAGTGKSELEKFVWDLLGDAVWRASWPTAAAIFQGLDNAARPVALDEIESEPGSRRVQELVKTARLASTDEQSGIARGSIGGTASIWRIRACFWFSSIIPAPLSPQDRSRIVVLDMGQLENAGEGAGAFLEARASFAGLGPRLRARLIAGWGRYVQNEAANGLVLAEDGLAARVQAQMGAILAGYWTLAHDRPITFEEARALAEALEPERFSVDAEDSNAALCLQRLMQSEVDAQGDNDGLWRVSIGHLLARNGGNPKGRHSRVLRAHGLAVAERPDPADPAGPDRRWLQVKLSHDLLDRQVYRETEWERGGWAVALARLPGAIKPRVTVNFGDYVSGKAVWLPWETLGERFADGDPGEVTGGADGLP